MFLLFIFALTILYGINFYVGRKFSYNKVHWVFEVSHFIGGFLLAGLFSNFISSSFRIVAGVLIVGILWELWELFVDRQPRLRKKFNQGPITLPDTILDLVLDLTGAIIFILFFK